MAALVVLVVYYFVLLFNFLSIVINSRNLMCLFLSKKKCRKQLEMLLLTVVVHMGYNTASNVHCGYLVVVYYRSAWSTNSIFWSGAFTFALSLSLVCGNISIVLDRLLAIKQPLLYSKKIKKLLLYINSCLLITVFLVALGMYHHARKDTDAGYPRFMDFVKFSTISGLYITRNLIVVLMVPATVAFLVEIRRLSRAAQTVEICGSLKLVNLVVLYQLLAEIAVIIIPTVITTGLNMVTGWELTSIAGSYPLALFSFYTTICSLLLSLKLRGNIGEKVAVRKVVTVT